MSNLLNAQLFRRAAFVLSFAALLLAPSFAGVETVELGEVQMAKTLSGVVADTSGAPLEKIQVIEVASDWHTIIRSTLTDTEGRWSLPPVPKKRIYYVRFVAKQCCFNEVRCRVKLNKRKGKELRISLPIST